MLARRAPHHGRASDRSYDFLDVVNPALTLFGNAPSEHLAYGAFRVGDYRSSPTIRRAACCIMLEIHDTIDVYVTNKKFAQSRTASHTFASPLHLNYHYLQAVSGPTKLKQPPSMPRNLLGNFRAHFKKHASLGKSC